MFNYSGGISRDGGHVIRGNAVEFRGGVGAGFVNKTTPPDTVIENNDWQAKLDWTRMVEDRLLRGQ